MTIPLLLGAMFGLGALLVVTAQPLGRPRPDLATRLHQLSTQGHLERSGRRAGAPVFQSALLERSLRPLLDDAGALVARVLAHAGIAASDLEGRLAVVSPGLDAAQFRGQQLATALVAALLLPLFNLLGLHPLGTWPAWSWAAAGAAGFAAPAWQLRDRLRRRREAVLAELPTVLDLLVIAGSAGLSPEQALLESGRQLEGTLPMNLREVARQASLGLAGYGDGLRALAEREDVPELRSLAEAWRRAEEQGIPLVPAMLALADSLRERRRTRLLEAGTRGSVRMLLPVALFIFPVFLVVLLYPAGVELLGLTS